METERLGGAMVGMLRMVTVALVLVAGGCAAPTPYEPITDGMGYGDQKLEQDRYRVWFAGNSVTPRPTVENYLLYRAAEVTLDNGQDWFEVVDQTTEVDTAYRTNATALYPGGFAPFPYSYRTLGVGTYTARSRPITRYEAFAVIMLKSGERPADNARAYDARQVVEALGPTVIRPAPSDTDS